MKTILLTVFGFISCLFGLGFLLYALYLYREGRRAKQVLSSIQVYTIGVFISVVMLFIPIYYTSYNFGDIYKFFRPFLIAVHNSLRIFILDGDFDIIVNSLSGQKTALRVCFSLYAAFLYVIAPILTFGNVLALFKNIRGELRYKWSNKKAYYVMSELNEKSIALAKSIFKEYQNKGNLKNISIVFMDVFEQNEEDDYETLTEARDIDAICLKKDISHLDITSKKGTVELFLIGNDESENVSQAVKITKDLNQKNKKQNVKVFVFSTKPSAAYIVDSIKYDNLLDFAAKHEYSENCFKLRRINEKQQLIWNTVPQMKLFELADRANKTLSVMILGFGSYGIEFFKMLIWFCQFEGYKLRVNIIDKLGKSSDEKDRVESLINRDCPELLKKNRTNVMGEAQYDIEIFPGVDVMSSDIGDILLYDGKDERMKYASERLKSTNLVFVSLGDDDRNIEVAIHMRHLFDRVNGVKAKDDIKWENEIVKIYSVVYDDQKSSILYNESNKDSHLLRNHQNVPYHIHFIGGMSSQFEYRNIYNAELEKCAYAHHRGWVDIEEQIYNDWTNEGKISDLENYEWYFKKAKSNEDAAKARKKYEQYEYYRLSSIAKELYQREIKNNTVLLSKTQCCGKEKKQTCKCNNCIRRKRSEHMRWNAYTRVIGYTYKEGIRADRALLHDNLCEWGKLSELDKQKD